MIGLCRGVSFAVVTAISLGLGALPLLALQRSEAQQWLLSDEALVSIGTADGRPEYELYRVVGAFRQSTGTIVVANQGTQELRFYGPDGSFKSATGREGGGPGEFRIIGFAARIHGDSIVTWDRQTQRISLFSPSGDFVTSSTISPVLPAEFRDTRASGAYPLGGAFADATVVLQPGTSVAVMVEGSSGVRQDTFPLYRYDRSGKPGQLLGSFPAAERYVANGSTSQLPFGARFLHAFATDRIYLATGKSPEIRVVMRDGRRATPIVFAGEPQSVTDDDIDNYKTRLLARMMPRSRPSTERELAAMPWPAVRPVFDAMTVDNEDRLWVREFRSRPNELARWRVFDATGELLARVTIPADLRITDIGTDYVLGVATDEYDTEHVAMFRLDRTTR